MQENIIELPLFISKANLDTDGKMQFAAVASDTASDSYQEEMSIGLYKSFLHYMDKGLNLPIYLSLAHYPRLEGRGEAGIVTELYIDGNQLKAKGVFNDNPLGRSVYNSIRKDRRDNVPHDKRVRISIGFYDRKHVHKSTNSVWEYSSGKPCYKCTLGVGDKIYLDGILEHLAVTRVPVNKRTDIVAKSEGENMTTRYEDALSIVGDEEIVNEVEKAFREKVGRSADEELITKSKKSVEVIVDKLLGGNTQEVLLKLVSKMTKEGKITEDELSKLVNEIMNQTTDRSEVKDTEDEEDEEEKKKKKDEMHDEMHEEKSETSVDKADVEKCDPSMPEVYQPFGGAVTLQDAQRAIQATKIENNVYYAYSMFGAVAQNILADKSLAVNDKLAAMQALTIEFKDLLSPDRLLVLSEAIESNMENNNMGASVDVKPLEDRISGLETKLEALVTELSNARTASVAEETPVVEPVVENVPAWKSIVNEFDSGLSNALSNSGENRLAALQEVINKAGQELIQLHTDMSTNEPVEVKSENIADVVEKAVTKQVGEIKDQVNVLANTLAQLTQLIQSQQVGQVRPQERSQTTPQPQPVQKSVGFNTPTNVPQSKGLSIAEIVNKTVR
jgi:hypothetical protein